MVAVEPNLAEWPAEALARLHQLRNSGLA
jgi:hypothetical protein